MILLVVAMPVYSQWGGRGSVNAIFRYTTTEKMTIDRVVEYLNIFQIEFYPDLVISRNDNFSLIRDFRWRYNHTRIHYHAFGWPYDYRLILTVEIHFRRPLLRFPQKHIINIAFVFVDFPAPVEYFVKIEETINNFMMQFDMFIENNNINIIGTSRFPPKPSYFQR